MDVQVVFQRQEVMKKVQIGGELLALSLLGTKPPLWHSKRVLFIMPALGADLATSCLEAQRAPPMSQGGIPPKKK